MAPRAKAEKRLDRETGEKYTEAEFIEYYGNKKGLKIWEAAGRAAEKAPTTASGKKSAGKAEKRLDRDTGVKYTEEEFLEFYGNKKGAKIWAAAGRAAEPAAASGSGTKAKGKAEKRLDRDTGKKITEAAFIELYGEKKGAKIWAAAGRAAEKEAASGPGPKGKSKGSTKREGKATGKAEEGAQGLRLRWCWWHWAASVYAHGLRPKLQRAQCLRFGHCHGPSSRCCS